MKNDFVYQNPVRIHFGRESLYQLVSEIKGYGKKILLAYGGGSIKKTGLYDQIRSILESQGKQVIDFPNITPNPTAEKAMEGAKLAKKEDVDLILAVGGGSVIDCAKAISVFAWASEDAFEKLYFRYEPINNKIIPLGVVLTMVGAGSEMNGGSVLTSQKYGYKVGRVFGTEVHPKFSILNPIYTYTVPKYQMVSGIFDVMSHLMEQYFSDDEDYTSDYIIEGLLRSLIRNAKKALENPKDYEARSNIMWAASLAASSLVGCSKSEDWQVHMIGHAIGAATNCAHGMALAAVSLPYYRMIYKCGLHKFVRFAKTVWNIDGSGMTDEEIAIKGLDALESFMKEIGLTLSISELGVREDMLNRITDTTFILGTGYKKLTKEDIYKILKGSL